MEAEYALQLAEAVHNMEYNINRKLVEVGQNTSHMGIIIARLSDQTDEQASADAFNHKQYEEEMVARAAQKKSQ